MTVRPQLVVLTLALAAGTGCGWCGANLEIPPSVYWTSNSAPSIRAARFRFVP